MDNQIIKHIIKEIMENESVNNDYKTPIDSKNVNYTDFVATRFPNDERDLHSIASNFIIVWDIEIESRSTGVKSIGSVLKNLSGYITIYDYDDSSFQKNEKIEIDLNPISSKWRTVNNMKVGDFGSLVPSNVRIDFENNIVTIY